jgi:hypothetical protein
MTTAAIIISVLLGVAAGTGLGWWVRGLVSRWCRACGRSLGVECGDCRPRALDVPRPACAPISAGTADLGAA